MSNYGPPYGYSLRRNGTCLSSEEPCGNPWSDWNNCCPEDTYCNTDNTCCPTDSECSAAIGEDPHCANNATWDLYDSDGYFCCLSDSTGFVASNLEYGGNDTTGVGCADGYPEGEYNSVLIPVARGNASESTSASVSATPSPTASTTNTPTAPPDTDTDSSSSTNTGAIVGGVIGGCAGVALIAILAWFLWRRRRQQKSFSGAPLMSPDAVAAPLKEQYGAYGPEQGGFHQAELDNSAVRAELYGNESAMAHELPASTTR
ncbi:hypothetical protein BDV06DRAFT_116065 [Aspergillus oleicola]